MTADIAKNIYDRMVSQQFVVSIMGSLDQELLKSLLKMIDRKLTSMEVGEPIKNRIFHFMVECVQNLCKPEDDEFSNNGLFLIGKEHNEYTIYLGTIFNETETENISQLVQSVNKMEVEEIKNQFYAELSRKEQNRQNILLVCLLNISKRTKDKINYEIIPVDNQHNFLSFKITISNAR